MRAFLRGVITFLRGVIALLRWVIALLRWVITLLREIADENAYQRHLLAHSRVHSAEEWRRFCDDRLARKFAQGKCC